MRTLSLLFLLAVPMWAAPANTAFAGCLNAAGCTTSSGTSDAVSLTLPAGNAAIAVVFTGDWELPTMASAGGGTWTLGCGPYGQTSGSGNGFTFWYNLNTSSASSVSATVNSGEGRGIIVASFSLDSGYNAALDLCNGTSAANYGLGYNARPGQAMGTLAGATDMVVQGIEGGNVVSAINTGFSICAGASPNCAGSPAANNRDAAYRVTGTNTTPTWTESAGGGFYDGVGYIALKEVQAASSPSSGGPVFVIQ
jgi:hypothetical protein